MRFLYVCNTSSDSISKINLQNFSEDKQISVKAKSLNKIGPHDICQYEDKLLTANSFGNSLSIISISEEEEIENYFIGMHCNGVRTFCNKAYIICGELNSVLVFNLERKKVIEEIPCGIFPHSIDVNVENELVVVTNMHSDSITVFNCRNRDIIKHVSVLQYPAKAIFSPDGKYIFVCESNIGVQQRGYLKVIEVKSLKVVERIRIGNSPVDLFADDDYCYVSNFGDGSISIIDIRLFKEVNRLKIGGMPRGIVRYKNCIYVGDNYNNLLIQFDFIKQSKKAITIGGEPTGMTLV